MEQYPLESLLTVRQYREEGAKRQVRSAELALREAEDAVEARKKELEAYRIRRREEEDRRYEAIMNIPMSLEDLDAFKAGLARLAAGETRHEHAVADAEREVEKRRADIEKAREAARKASRNTSKIQAHKDIWKEDAKKEAERQEDLELEEFRPLSRKGAEAEGEDA